MKYLLSFFLLFSSSTAFSKEEAIKIVQLTENVYQHISYKTVEPWGKVAASGLIVIEGENAHIIDTPWTDEGSFALIDWIKSKNLIIKSSIATHSHEDASGGITLLNKKSIPTYATTLTNQLLGAEQKELASNEIVHDEFEHVTGTIETFYPGKGHSPDNIVVWLPKAQILFGGCFVKSLSSKNLGYTGDASIEAWPHSIQRVLNKYPNIKTVVPGHGTIGDIALLKHTAQLALAHQAKHSTANK